MSEYIFGENQPDHEWQRLRRIETALDAQTQSLLTKTAVTAGWNCLEVGAGGGSIVQWLGERVGSGGKVVGIDKRTAYLGRFEDPRFEIIEGDVLEFATRERFNLIHARYVLIHNRTATDILTHLMSLLMPGGYLVLEEPDFESAEWIDEEYGTAGTRVNRAIGAMFSSLQLDPGYGKRLPWRVSRLGLTVRYVEAKGHLQSGGQPIAGMMADSAHALRGKYVSTGEATQGDVDRYIQGARDPRSWATYYSTVSVVARQRE